MTASYSSTVQIARDYYNSDDADGFYATIWGGEDIHIGLYETDRDSIVQASRRTVRRMLASISTPLSGDSRVLDLGAGYGGAARYLATETGCRVTALNLSEVENDRHRALNRDAGLDHRITVIDGNFEEIPAVRGTFDVVWSQDALLHTEARARVLQEAHRVLKPGGEMVFTDPMAADDCPYGVLAPILARLHLESLSSPGYYLSTASELGLRDAQFDDHTPQLTRHYGRVLEETIRRRDELEQTVSSDYIDRMCEGLRHWVEGGNNGHLAWGIFHLVR